MVKKEKETTIIPLEVRKKFVKEIEEHVVKTKDSFITIFVGKSKGRNKISVLSDLELEEIIGYLERTKHDMIANKNIEDGKSNNEDDFKISSYVR